jgi:2-keto-4-pentenoate hydratase
MTTPDHLVDEAAKRLEEAYATRTPCSPVRELIGETDIAAAYAVQQRQADHRIAAGARVIGRKTGLTNKAVQQQLGVDQPDFGVLFDDMDVTGEPQVPSIRLLQPKAEAEIAFVLGADLIDGDLDLAQCRDAVAHATGALEIVDSRVADWDIRITDTVADNASSGLFVLGDQHVPLDGFEPVEVTMRMYLDGALVSEGTGAACLGDPLHALSWLARIARDYGQPLTAGQVVLSGALGPMVSAPPGCSVRAEISGLGEVTAQFSELDRTTEEDA